MSQAPPSSSHSRTSSITHAASAFNSTRQLPKTPHSQRYAGASPTLDTGRHIGNQVVKRDRSHELFKRISSSRLCYLLDGADQADETVFKLGYENPSSTKIASHVATVSQYDSQLSARTQQPSSSSSTSTSTSASASKSTSSSDQKESKKSDPTFMLLDVRDQEEYDKCHIDGATHYPAINLKRDQISSTMYSHRSAGHLFILYEDDGESKLANEAGTLFVQKAFDNVHILNGGLSAFALRYPDRVSGTDVTSYIKQATAALPPSSRSGTGSGTNRGSTSRGTTTSSSSTSSRPTSTARSSVTESRRTTRPTSTSSSSRPTSSTRHGALDTDRPKPFR